MLLFVFGIFVLVFFKPYSDLQPYLKVVFDPESNLTSGDSQVSLYHSDNMKLNIQEADINDTVFDDGDDEEKHTFVYPYYGDYYANLNIPNAGMKDIPVYCGTELDVLEKGAGWYYASVFIGKKGNCVIAGHNHTYFFLLPQVKKGDLVTLETSYCKLTYIVRETVVFHEDDYTYIDPIPDADILTLMTCWNNGRLGMSQYRLGVICDIVEREWKDVEVPAE